MGGRVSKLAPYEYRVVPPAAAFGGRGIRGNPVWTVEAGTRVVEKLPAVQNSQSLAYFLKIKALEQSLVEGVVTRV